jgi:hypothetical protein
VEEIRELIEHRVEGVRVTEDRELSHEPFLPEFGSVARGDAGSVARATIAG